MFQNMYVLKAIMHLLSFNYSRLFFHERGKYSVIGTDDFWGTIIDTLVFSRVDISMVKINHALSKAFFCRFVVNLQEFSELK